MLYAIGTDIVDLDRFSRALNRWGDRFIRRILTDAEIRYCEGKRAPASSMAVRFAAKEAMIKCLPTDQGLTWRWHEMQVLGARDGKPVVILHGELERFLKGKRVLLTLSHSVKSAVAVVAIEVLGGES